MQYHAIQVEASAVAKAINTFLEGTDPKGWKPVMVQSVPVQKIGGIEPMAVIIFEREEATVAHNIPPGGTYQLCVQRPKDERWIDFGPPVPSLVHAKSLLELYDTLQCYWRSSGSPSIAAMGSWAEAVQSGDCDVCLRDGTGGIAFDWDQDKMDWVPV